FRGDRDCAIARQPARPFVVACFERLLDEQTAETGAVDEQVAFDRRAALHRERFDPAVLAALTNRHDFAFYALDTALLGKCTQVLRIESGVELESVAVRRQQ